MKTWIFVLSIIIQRCEARNFREAHGGIDVLGSRAGVEWVTFDVVAASGVKAMYIALLQVCVWSQLLKVSTWMNAQNVVNKPLSLSYSTKPKMFSSWWPAMPKTA